jgi:trk system potassium uptake protein TrkH
MKPISPKKVQSRRIRISGSTKHLKQRWRIPVAMRLVLGLVLLIGVGTAVLLLPGMTTKPITFVEALFTATSAATVTGLSILTTSTDFTLLGKIVLLILIQMGGVGFIALMVLILRLIGQKVSLRNRLAISGTFGVSDSTAVLPLLARAFLGMLIIEAVGAVLLAWHWQSSGIVIEGVGFYALFHAISAFCNAGFDLFYGLPQYPDGLPSDNVSLLIMGGMVFIGGLGLPLFVNFAQFRERRRLSINTRITLFVIIFLTLGGWLGLFIAESQPEGVIQHLSFSERLVQTWFQSVSTRTAGFPGLESFHNLTPESQLLVMVLMFIGCAPASMGGGITTGTFAVLTLVLANYIRGRADVQVLGRRVTREVVLRATAVLTISMGVVFVASWLILITNNFDFNLVLFEVVSALATCGLSLGITGDLNTFGRLILVFVMFWGRLGALTIVIALIQRRPTEQLVQYPETTVLIG